MKTALMLCTGNSCRSQMAHVLAEKLFPSDWIIYSAGTEKHGLNQNAMETIRNNGHKTDHLQSQNIDELDIKNFDLVFSVCNRAEESCPHMPAKVRIHHSFDDPPKLSAGLDKQDALPIYQRVFEEIETFMTNKILPDLN